MSSRLRRWTLALGIALGGGALAGALVASPTPASADVDDFSYDRWDVAYELDTDAEGRAVAHVTETLTARFPDFDQNRGIVRGLPERYESAPTDPRDFSVTDAAGDEVPFEIEEDDGFVAVLTGDDDYVHGTQTYVIEYTLSDVILNRDDGKADEFYWDLTDFEHEQPIDAFSATITFSDSLAQRLDGNARCYVGEAESTSQCGIDRGGDSFGVSVPELGPHEGVSVAIGLEPGSVEQPPLRTPNFTLDGLPLVIGIAGLGTGIAGAVANSRMKRRRRTARGTVVAQYDVPPALPPLLAAKVVRTSANPVPAEIVHLAVTGAIRIEEGEEGHGLFGTGKPQPVLRLVDPARAADPLDQSTVRTLFPSLEPGTAVELPKKDESFAKRMTKLAGEGTEEARRRGYFTKDRSPVARTLGLVTLGILAVLTVFIVLGLVLRGSPAAAVFIALGVVVLLFGVSNLVKHRVYTRTGAEWREYLEGVKLFISVAEADRLQMLQSYRGAERRQDGDVDVVHLYERLLPYAMMFGLEKGWAQVLEVKYQEQPGYVPVWYPAVATHGFDSLTSTISSFTSSLNSSVSYTSSSSGGSTGGGFAGGGGGGGFSGGR